MNIRLPGLALILLLGACADSADGPRLSERSVERTTAGHALFLDLCIRHLGAPEALQSQAERHHLHQVEAELRAPDAEAEPMRMWGLPRQDGGVDFGLAFSASARSCSVFFRDPDPGLALAFTAQLALARSRLGAEVTPIVRNATALAATVSGYRVQAGEAPGADWSFGVTIARDGLAVFHAQLRQGDLLQAPRAVLRRT